MRTIVIASFLAASLAVAAAPAADAQSMVSRAVGHADLDLSTAAGQAALSRRIARAVRDLCGTASDVDLAGRNEVRRCRDDARALAALRRQVATASTATPAAD